MATKIFAYNTGSKGAHNLAEAMDVYLIRHNNSRYIPKRGDTVINWGTGKDWTPARTLNKPEAVAVAVNKLRFFRKMNGHLDDHLRGEHRGPRIPEFTTEIKEARQWARDGHKVVARRILNGREGKGIEICTEAAQVPAAPLYTRYVPKQAEYRIHMVGSKIIDEQRKVLRNEVERKNINWHVRNTANGFVFQRNGIQVPADVQVQALRAIEASALDFGAVDVIWNEKQQKAYVLEINTAPGIEGTTVTNYANSLRRLINNGD